MAKRARESDVQGRTTLPRDFVVPEAAFNKMAVFCVLLGGGGLFGVYGAFVSTELGGKLVAGVFGIAALAVAALVLPRLVRSVHMDEEGLVVRRVSGATAIAWSDISRVVFEATSKADQDRSSRGAAIGGVLGGGAGGLIGGLVAGGTSGGDGEHRPGDPYADGRLRRHYEPQATLTAPGRRSFHFSADLGWAFFSALRTQCLERGVPVAQVVPAGVRPPRQGG